MPLYNSPQAYVFNLQTTSSAEAKRMWRRKIKEEWDLKCAYCGSEEGLTLDHIVPRSKGGADYTKNVVIKIKVILLGKIGIFLRSFLVLSNIKRLKPG
jgi:hypothetical protein